MLNKIILFCSSLISVLPSTKAIRPTSANVGIVITPLIYKKVSYITVASEGTSSTPSTIKAYIINEQYPDGILLFSKTFSSISTYLFTYENEYTCDTNTFKFIYSYKGGTASTLSRTVDVSTSSIKYLDDERVLKSSGVHRHVANKGWSTGNETLTFTGFDDYYIPDYYHKLDPSIFTISQEGPFTNRLILDNSNLLISNLNGVFDNLTSSTKWAQLKLKAVKSGSTYHLEFAENLYVNPLTLKMYKTKTSDTVKTKYLFFPRNEMRSQGDYTCALSLGEFGVNRDKLVHYFTMKATLNLFGDCRNSEYCIGVTTK